jgi:hypothetical protein
MVAVIMDLEKGLHVRIGRQRRFDIGRARSSAASRERRRASSGHGARGGCEALTKKRSVTRSTSTSGARTSRTRSLAERGYAGSRAGVECVAMGRKYLAGSFDVHTGT